MMLDGMAPTANLGGETHIACIGGWSDNGGFCSKGHHCDDLSSVGLINQSGEVGAWQESRQDFTIDKFTLRLQST